MVCMNCGYMFFGYTLHTNDVTLGYFVHSLRARSAMVVLRVDSANSIPKQSNQVNHPKVLTPTGDTLYLHLTNTRHNYTSPFWVIHTTLYIYSYSV